jgi:hypothetical protein
MSAIRRFAPGADLCLQLSARDVLWRRTSNIGRHVGLVRDEHRRAALQEGVEANPVQPPNTRPLSFRQLGSSNQSNSQTRNASQRRRLDAAKQAFVWFPGAASGDKAPGRFDDGAACALTRTCKFKRIVHTGELLGVQALHVQQAVSINVKNAKGPVDHARRCAIHHFNHDAGLANALSSKVWNTGEVFASERSCEGRAGQRVNRVVSGDQKQPR